LGLILIVGCYAANDTTKTHSGLQGTPTDELPAVGQLSVVYDKTDIIDPTSVAGNGERYCTGTLVHPGMVATTAFCLANYTGRVREVDIGMGDDKPKYGAFIIDGAEGKVPVPLTYVASAISRGELQKTQASCQSVAKEAAIDIMHPVWAKQRAFLARDQGLALLRNSVPPEIATPLGLSDGRVPGKGDVLDVLSYGRVGDDCRTSKLPSWLAWLDGVCSEAYIMMAIKRPLDLSGKHRASIAFETLAGEGGSALFCPGDGGAPLLKDMPTGLPVITGFYSATSGPNFNFAYWGDPRRVNFLQPLIERYATAQELLPPVVARDSFVVAGDERVHGDEPTLTLSSDGQSLSSFALIEWSFVGLPHHDVDQATIHLSVKQAMGSRAASLQIRQWPAPQSFSKDVFGCNPPAFRENVWHGQAVDWPLLRSLIDRGGFPVLGEYTLEALDGYELDVTALLNRVLKTNRRLVLMINIAMDRRCSRSADKARVQVASKEDGTEHWALGPQLSLSGVRAHRPARCWDPQPAD